MAVPSQEYLKTKVMTASPEMLTLMLWDGAIRFAEQGKEAIVKKEIEGSYKSLLRSQKIIAELISNLRHKVDPDLCGKLAALYNFIYRRLVEANMTKEPKLVDDALEIMRHQRDTWSLLIDKLSKERANEAQATINANADAISSAEDTSQAVQSAASPPLVSPSVSPSLPGAPRRAYPAFAVRPAASVATLSVQG